MCVCVFIVFKDLTSFLTEEIKAEHESSKKLPTVSGFTTKTDGPNVTFTKKHNDEEVSVTFSVNNALDGADPSIDEASLESDKPDKEPEVGEVCTHTRLINVYY